MEIVRASPQTIIGNSAPMGVAKVRRTFVGNARNIKHQVVKSSAPVRQSLHSLGVERPANLRSGALDEGSCRLHCNRLRGRTHLKRSVTKRGVLAGFHHHLAQYQLAESGGFNGEVVGADW